MTKERLRVFTGMKEEVPERIILRYGRPNWPYEAVVSELECGGATWVEVLVERESNPQRMQGGWRLEE